MKNIGLKIGAGFTVGSLLLTLTIAVPMLTVFPSELLRQKLQGISERISDQQAGAITIGLFAVFLLLALVFTWHKVIKIARVKQHLKGAIIAVTMFVFYFIIHNLLYYILLGLIDFPLDALNTFMAVYTFPIGSLLFILIGWLIDQTYKKYKVD